MILGDYTSFQAALKCCKSTVYYDEDDDEGKLWISDKLTFYNSIKDENNDEGYVDTIILI